MKIFKTLFLFIFFHCSSQKVVILTHVYNRPEFIKLQYDLYKKFLKDDYELIIFDNSEEQHLTAQMKKECEQLNLKYIRIPQSIHTSKGISERVATALNLSFKILNFKCIYAIISSDVFLIKDFSITDYLNGYDIAGHYQNREHIEYIWDGIAFLNMNTLPKKDKINFNCGYVENILTDVGGNLYHYFKQFPDLKIKYFDQIYIGKNENEKIKIKKSNGKYLLAEKEYNYKELKGFNNNELQLIKSGIDNFEFFIDKAFLHYRNGTNWNKQDENYHFNKMKLIKTFLKIPLN